MRERDIPRDAGRMVVLTNATRVVTSAELEALYFEIPNNYATHP